MVKYISQYDALVQAVHSSDAYKNANQTEKTEIGEWLNREDVIRYFSGIVVPQLTLHESIVLGFANSDALRQITPEEQQKVLKRLNSTRFKQAADNLEGRMSQLLPV